MAKGKKIHTFHPPQVNITHPQENFAEMYSFDKKSTIGPRERMVGVDRWDKKYCDESYEKEARPKEHSFKKGEPHKFSHTKREGKTRTSGVGHRIGKR